MTATAILLAAGRGERLAADRPKGFVDLGGRPLLAHALEAVMRSERFHSVAVTVPRGWEMTALELTSGWGGRSRTIVDGESRQVSVRMTLEVLSVEGPAPDAVVCHDVARPFAAPELFRAVLDALKDAEGAVPAVPVRDTIKAIENGSVARTLDRAQLVAAQTPQAFRFDALVKAHQRAAREGFEGTDDAAILEWAGHLVTVVPGDPMNLKVTTEADLRIAEMLLAGRE